jgi:uncharacterized glyoxalase superfamily protein PhnB
MAIVPLFKISNMNEALRFYTTILDFHKKYPDDDGSDGVLSLVRDDVEFEITTVESDRLFGSVAYIIVDDVDPLFRKFLERGLDISNKQESEVHQGPVDQTWGAREFYVTDSDGNTLRFRNKR